MRSNHQVEVSYRLSILLQHSTQSGIVLRRQRIPGEDFNPQEEFLYYDSELGSIRQPSHAEAQFRFRDHGNSNFSNGNFQQTFADVLEIAFDDVTDSVGVEKIAKWHLKKSAPLRRSIFAIRKKIARNLGVLGKHEKLLPTFQTARENYVSRCRIAAHVHF